MALTFSEWRRENSGTRAARKANMLTVRQLMNLGAADHPDPDIITRIGAVARYMRDGRTAEEAMVLTEPDPVWNVKVAVVMNLRAPDRAAAIAMLTRSLYQHGFEPLIDGGPDYADAFEAEDGTDADDLPARKA